MPDNKETTHSLYHEELPQEHPDPLISFLHRIIRMAVRIMAVMMVLVIIWGVADVAYVMVQRLIDPPYMLLDVNDIFQLFGAFMVVLIAVEIFINIRLYLGTDALPVQLVVATALMAVARKVIMLDMEKTAPEYLYGIAAAILALGISYWLLSKKH